MRILHNICVPVLSFCRRGKGHVGASFGQSDEEVFLSTSSVHFSESSLQVKATNMSDLNNASSQLDHNSPNSTALNNNSDVIDLSTNAAISQQQPFFHHSTQSGQLPSQHPVVLMNSSKMATRATRLGNLF